MLIQLPTKWCDNWFETQSHCWYILFVCCISFVCSPGQPARSSLNETKFSFCIFVFISIQFIFLWFPLFFHTLYGSHSPTILPQIQNLRFSTRFMSVYNSNSFFFRLIWTSCFPCRHSRRNLYILFPSRTKASKVGYFPFYFFA